MDQVSCAKRERIADVTPNRPDALDALDDELNRDLWQVWSDLYRDATADVAILSGAGNAFCAGADLRSSKWGHANLLDVRKNIPTGIGGGITRGQHRIAKLIIAAING